MDRFAGKVLITGGLGYVGGRIATHLSRQIPRLSLRLTTRRTPALVPPWAESLDVVQADVLDAPSLIAALDGVDTVVHLAAVNEIESQRDPDLALEVNGRGTCRLLKACRERGVSKFIYFSTFHVYGPGAPTYITEEAPTRPVHPYAITHRLAEDFVNWHRHAYGMQTLVLRLSNGYGYPADPWVQRWTLVFNDLCLQAVKNGEIRLRSQGLQQRDFVSLTDVARGVHHLLDIWEEGWSDGLFNFGGECPMSIRAVANFIADQFADTYGRKIPVITGEGVEAEAAPVHFSVAKLKGTGFSLLGNMSEEVQKTFELCERIAIGDRQER